MSWYLKRRDLLIPVLVAGGWLLSLLAIRPFGEYPVNDDWAYTHSVEVLFYQHKFFINQWPGMTLFSHILWGWAFCKLFGFSFLTLRISVIVLGVVGIFSAYHLTRLFTQNRLIVALATMLTAFNPFYFSLSASFMTDVGFTAVSTMTALLFTKYLFTGRTKFLCGAVVLCIVSVLMRQIGVLMPLAFIPALLLRRKFSFSNLLFSLLPGIISLSVLFLFSHWLSRQQTLPVDFGTISVIVTNFFSDFFYYLWERLGYIVFYVVTIAVPVSFFGFPELWRSATKRRKYLVLLIIVPLLFFVNNIFYTLPLGNVVFNFGIGPRTLKDTYYNLVDLYRIPKDLINVFNLFLLLSIVPFGFRLLDKTGRLIRLLRRQNTPPHELATLSIIVFIVLYAVFLIFNRTIFDRYFLPLYPFILILALPDGKWAPAKKHMYLSTVYLLLVAGFSLAATHDYHSWHKSRREAASFLSDRMKVPVSMIDGGFEFNGWTSRDHFRRKPGTNYTRFSKSFWFVDDDPYLVASTRLPGYQRLTGFPVSSFLPTRQDSVYVLSRIPFSRRSDIRFDLERVSPHDNFCYTADFAHVCLTSGILSSSVSYSGKQALLLRPSTESWMKARIGELSPLEKIVVSIWKYPAGSQTKIRASSSFSLFFDTYTSDNIVDTRGDGWVKIEIDLSIPPGFGRNRVDILVTNPGPSDGWVDDLQITRLAPQAIPEDGN